MSQTFVTVYWSQSAREPESRVIARGLRQREPDLLHNLIVQYQPRLLQYLTHLSGNRDLAQDLFQETWVRVLERSHYYNGQGAFSTWLYTLARNLTIDKLRQKQPLSLDSLLQDEEPAMLDPVDPGPAAWELIARSQQVERVHEALGAVPAQYREVVVLRFLDALALEEIASVIGVPLGTVKSRLYRGIEMLMKDLEDEQA